mmetsp:Transcript_32229/g.49305  ORF Transcript_32229/g.49305 Transcript_32229/m.49305 type:complete len:87 (-) Transcript_32229:202-462(-)
MSKVRSLVNGEHVQYFYMYTDFDRIPDVRFRVDNVPIVDKHPTMRITVKFVNRDGMLSSKRTKSLPLKQGSANFRMRDVLSEIDKA